MIEERCRNNHVRTPATTYVAPNGKRHCRLCSGKMAAGELGLGQSRKGRPSEVFDELQLARLRYLVRCMGCGAVPRDTGRKREHQNQHGETTSLPIVVTDHAPGCPVDAQAPARGRPKHDRRADTTTPCVACGAPCRAAVGRTKKYCSEVCKSKVLRARRAQRVSA